MAAPIFIRPIPPQTLNEHTPINPLNFQDYIQPSADPIHFQAQNLPKGLECSAEGLLTGTPGADTRGQYEVRITAENEAGKVETTLNLTIRPALANPNTNINQIKAEIWAAVNEHLPAPDLVDMVNRPITLLDVYYLWERWAGLKIWDAFNLDAPGEKHLLNLPGASKHYDVYDRGSCLICTPKDLFSYERTLEDGLKTARAMAREVYQRAWTIELVGFDKLVRAAWVEIQLLNDEYGKRLEIINFSPTDNDVNLYTLQTQRPGRIKDLNLG